MRRRTHERLQVLLKPDGRVLTSLPVDDPAARWQVVGWTREAGAAVSFIRAEIAGASWAAIIPSTALAAPAQGAVVVVLSRQTPADQVPLSGWARFC